MQANEEGEFIPEKELDKNFKIPKRKAGEMEADSPQQINSYNSYYNQQTPLADSYYNYQYDPTVYYGAYAEYYAQYNAAVSGDNSQSQTNVVPLTKGICKALTETKEKPKNCRPNIFERTVPDVIDETLPKDLKLLFQPLFCKLCSAQLSSNLNAKMHYKSKNHEKKIKRWLTEYSERTGEPLHKRAKVVNEKKDDETEKNPNWYHCDVCDLPLTSKLHAESHYMGKNHQRAVTGHKTPAGLGFYNSEGKWVRTKPIKQVDDFESCPDNFGISFRQTDAEKTGNIVANTILQNQSKFYCEMCNISTTCQEQLECHFRGSKHQRKLKQLGLSQCAANREVIDQPEWIERKGNIAIPPIAGLDAAVQPPAVIKSEINLSVYRTPSGDFYCLTCNISSNSEAQFLQHMRSKNHNKKLMKKQNN